VTEQASEAECRAYREVGYVVREAALRAAELEPLCDAAEAVHQRVLDEARGAAAAPVERIDGKRYQRLLGSSVKWEWRDAACEIRSMEPYHHLDARLDALIDDPRLWAPAASLIDAEAVSLFSDKLNFKRPDGAPFPWHQDTPYWAFDCAHLESLVNVLVCLDATTRDNGCMWVIPGSHLHGRLACHQDRGVLGRLYTDVDLAGLGEPIALELPPGSLVYFHGDLVHGSRSNRTQASRRTLVLTYQPAAKPRWQHDDIRSVEDRSA
jgi:ectoine hydroxylase-related dioxygenase (phytanoyl-CoA dioxygenase family)